MPFFQRRRETLIGIGLLLFSVAYYWGSFQIKTRNILGSSYGPELLPRIYGGALVVLSILLIISDLIKASKEKNAEGEAQDSEKARANRIAILRIIGTILLVLIYIAAIVPVGFLISSACYMMLQLLMICPKGKFNYLKFAIVSVVAAILIEYLFMSVFSVPLPEGIFALH